MATNVFAKAAENAVKDMNKINTKRKDEKKEELKGISVRLSPSLHHAVCKHRLETGESGNSLIVRLLEDELGTK